MAQTNHNELAKIVRYAILGHEDYKNTWRIDILENASVITLIGSVPTKKDLIIVEDIAKQQEGVMSVVNELDIKSVQEGEDVVAKGYHIRILPPRR